MDERVKMGYNVAVVFFINWPKITRKENGIL